jgi:glycyl-tRNA synthetase beta chain
MPELLLELFSEEIPARMQAPAARDLERMARERLAEQGLLPAGLKTYAGPRRLTLVADGLPPAQADRTEERKGPRANAPVQAIDGFLRSTGLTRDQLVERDGVYFAVIAKTGRPTPQIVAEVVEGIVRSFPWPKSMTWGSGTLRWVRPLQRILCVFDGEIVPLSVDGLEASNLTEAHRFMGPRQLVRARTFEEYEAGLRAGYVVLDQEERKQRIMDAARTLCFARNLELVEDEGLLEEVSGLAEWPTPILGDMDPAFLDLPPEVIRTSMRTHQKYFAVRDPAKEGLAPHFLVVANIEATDGGREVAAGNAKVLSARLSDARFFWDEDRKVGFEPWLKKLQGVTFHADLGSMAARVDRITRLSILIAPVIGADPELAARAAQLAKADLASGMVGEFPELQGLMGGYYARAAGLPDEIATAIRDHYRPQGPNDSLPEAPAALAVALADKLDTLTGFFAIHEKPTGSKDPYALRRAALGVLRIILGRRLRLPLTEVLRRARWNVLTDKGQRRFESVQEAMRQHAEFLGLTGRDIVIQPQTVQAHGLALSLDEVSSLLSAASNDLLAFFADRLKVLLRDQGKRHDLVDAVFALGDDDIVRIVDRVEALDAFLKTDDGANLLAGYRRATNILKAEEKKGVLPTGLAALRDDAPAEERALINVLAEVLPKVATHLQAEQFSEAMSVLSSLRGPVDAFFDKVLVNADDAAVRESRLRLLTQVRDAMGQVADFSLIAG